jgi:hypothetical protein
MTTIHRHDDVINKKNCIIFFYLFLFYKQSKNVYKNFIHTYYIHIL